MSDASGTSRDAARPSEGGSVVAFPHRDAPAPPDNLPLELSSFVGREREMAETRRLLLGNRLLTLTGPGGSGKTRLALAVAAGLSGSFGDGVWLVELAPLSDPEDVPQALASVLVREEEHAERGREEDERMMLWRLETGLPEEARGRRAITEARTLQESRPHGGSEPGQIAYT
jgi:hypothetical protein